MIYKGEAQYKGCPVQVKKVQEAHFSHSTTGFTNRSIGLGYLQQNFDLYTVKRLVKVPIIIIDIKS